MATRRSSPDQENFFRMTVLIVDNALKVLQDVLQKELRTEYPSLFDPSTGLLCGVLGDGTVRKKLDRLVRSRVLNVHQQNQLYPGGNPSSSVTVGDLDITLTVLLLRNITTLNPHPPLNAWDNPSDTDTSREATIGRVKRYRNVVYGHANKAAISDQDFRVHFSGLKSNLLDLSSMYTDEDYDAILSKPLDDALLERNQSILKGWYNYDIDVKDQLVKVIHELKEGETKLQDHVEQVHKRSEDTILKKMDSVAQNTHNKLEDISQGITQVNVGQSEMTDQLRQHMEEVKDAQKQDSQNIQAQLRKMDNNSQNTHNQLEELSQGITQMDEKVQTLCDRDRNTPAFQKIAGSVDLDIHMRISPSGMEAVKSSATFSSSQKTPSLEDTQPDREALAQVTSDGSDTDQITGISPHLDEENKVINEKGNLKNPEETPNASYVAVPPLELTTPLCEAKDRTFLEISRKLMSQTFTLDDSERAVKLMERYHAMLYDTKRQCFIIRLVCPSVHSLDHLWQSYHCGELQAAVEESFVSIKTLEDLGLRRSDINLWVKMDEDDYNECRKYIKEKTELKAMIYEDLKMTVRKGPYGSAEQTIYGIRQALMAAFTLRKEDILIKWWDYGSPGYWAVICYGIQPHHVGHIEDDIQDLPKDDLRELGVMTINIGSQTLRLTGEDVPQELGAWNVEKGDIGSEYSASESGYHTGSRLTTELDADSTCIGDYEADEGVNFYLEQPRQDSLPITSHREQIVSQIQDNVVTFITGETGSGKSTQVPQYILADCVKRRMKKVRILVAEPRQLAAVTLAERVSKEQGDPNVGCTVGYSAGDKREISKDTKITFVTTGALLENLIHRPSHFTKYTHIILDEVHERRMEFDLLLWMIRKLMTSVPNNTKLVLMSATMQKDIYVRFFQDLSSWDSAPIFVGVHQHPVTEVYLEDISDHVWTLSEDVRRYYVKKIAKCNGWDDSDFRKSVDTFLEENVKTDGPEVDKEGEELDTDTEESETDDETLEKERTGYSNLRQKIFSDHGVLHESAVKKRSYALERIVVSLIQEYLKPGETLVVFLDGMLSIEKLGDALGEFEPNPPAEWPVDHLRVIVLHSQIPPEDQGDAFKAPEANCGHVVLTTNIAENAVTVPQVRVVIDLGWKRQPVYDVTSRLTTLQRTHISKASAKQRKGRTGRVFEKGNLVIRLYTRKLYRELENFDKPDIQTAPLEKVVLKARQAATNAFPDLRSKEILQDTIEPPDISNIDDGIKVLWENGAFTENSDMSSITMLGHLAMQLPVDLKLSRLVLYGILFGCAVEGIILAAALASKDPFMMPTKKVIKNTEEFVKSLHRSEKSRRKFDGGACSEPIALLNLFKKWLEWSHNEKGKMVVDTSVSMWDIKKEFCENNAVSLSRLNAYESLITRLASSVLKYVSDQSIACKIRALVFFISDTREVDNPCVTSQTDFFHPSDLFISSAQPDLKALLLAALHPAFLVGETMNKLHYVKTDVYPFKEYTNLETKMKANKMDMKRTIYVPAKPTVYNKNDECKVRAIEKLAKLCKFSQQTLPELKPAEKGSLFIQYKGARPGESKIFHDITKDAHSLFKFSEGRHSIIFPGEKRLITLEQPMHPFRIHWSLLSIRGTDMMSPEQREYPCTGFPNWRAPFASACDLDQQTYLAVTHNFINWKHSVGHINGMTILPQGEGNMLALCLILTFQPKHFSTRFIVDIWRQRITHLELFRHRFAIPEASELTEEILDHINQFRKDLSEALCADLKNQGLSEFCSMERFLTRLKQLMEKEKHQSRNKLSKLVQDIREAIADAETFRQLPDKFKLLGALKDKETPSIDDIIKTMTQGTDYEESTQDLDYRYNVEIAIKAMIPSETQDEELTYLPPYNCEVFSMAYLKQQKDQQDADNNMAYSKITARAAGPDYFEFSESDTSEETSSDGEEWEFMDAKQEEETSVDDKPIPEQKKDDLFPYHPVVTAPSITKRRHRKRKDSVSESVPVNIPGVDVVPQLMQHDIDGITAALDTFVDMCQGLPTPKPAYVRNFMGNRHYQVLGLRLREEQLAAVIQYCDKYKVEEGGDMGPVVCEKS